MERYSNRAFGNDRKIYINLPFFIAGLIYQIYQYLPEVAVDRYWKKCK